MLLAMLRASTVWRSLRRPPRSRFSCSSRVSSKCPGSSSAASAGIPFTCSVRPPNSARSKPMLRSSGSTSSTSARSVALNSTWRGNSSVWLRPAPCSSSFRLRSYRMRSCARCWSTTNRPFRSCAMMYRPCSWNTGRSPSGTSCSRMGSTCVRGAVWLATVSSSAGVTIPSWNSCCQPSGLGRGGAVKAPRSVGRQAGALPLPVLVCAASSAGSGSKSRLGTMLKRPSARRTAACTMAYTIRSSRNLISVFVGWMLMSICAGSSSIRRNQPGCVSRATNSSYALRTAWSR